MRTEKKNDFILFSMIFSFLSFSLHPSIHFIALAHSSMFPVPLVVSAGCNPTPE
jgi:hypothetical protein